MSKLAQSLKNRFYRDEDHPYRKFEQQVSSLVKRGDVLLDAGCGRTAPVLRLYADVASRLIGVDLVEPRDMVDGIEYHQADLASIPVASNSVDLVISRSVFEHLSNPQDVYRELHRILKPGGRIVFLTANSGDYATLAAKLIPNQYHARLVNKLEGRPEEDTFPTEYRTNSRSVIERLARQSGLELSAIQYLNQYPNYFMLNSVLFALGIIYERITSRFHALRFFRGWLLVTLRRPHDPSQGRS